MRLRDVETDYRDGILLNPGDYRIRVSAPEYETLEERFSHGFEPTIYSVELARSPQPFTVIVTPAEANVSVVGLAEDYEPEMRLPPGEYLVRVAAAQYKPYEGSVRHGTEATRFEVTLQPKIPGAGGAFSDELASGGEGPVMVVIPVGSFRMGCLSNDDDCYADEQPVHDVRIRQQFALSKFEITRVEFRRFVEATSHSAGNACWRFGETTLKGAIGRTWLSPGFEQTSADPVVCVSWHDAKAYVAWLSRETGESYRLPTESEWEYAARAGYMTKWACGNEASRLCQYGNHADQNTDFGWRNEACSDGVGNKPAQVGSYHSNEFGLHDMHGNALEWVEDCWHSTYQGAPTDGEAWVGGDCKKRVLRGGDWTGGPRMVRSAYRASLSPGGRFLVTGIRVVRVLSR